MKGELFGNGIISGMALCLALVSVSLSSCIRKEAEGMGLTVPVDVRYVIAPAEPYGEGTRSVLAEADERKIHAAFLAFYDENGLIQAECDASRDGTVRLDANRTYSVYFLANMYRDGRHLHAALHESEMKSLSYRMDGMQGREKITDIADSGIPMSWSAKGWKPSQGVIEVRPRKLFSKVALTIDKSSLVGSQTAVEIRNLRIRSNLVLKPFGTGVAAQAASDMTETGIDYAEGTIVSGDDDMRLVVYVPENMQGNLNGGNSSSVDKIPPADREPLCSRVSCTAKVLAPKLEVDADYQFYIGKDASQNYDLERNCLYDVTMILDPEHIFKPTWQVRPSITSDSRDIALCHPVSGAALPDDGQVIAVRLDRPARFRLKVNGVDALKALNVDPDSNYSRLDADCWSSDAFCPDKSKAAVYRKLADNGITLTMDPSTGVFSAAVTDPSRFVAGRDIEARFWLMPDHKKELRVIFRTMEPMSFTMDTQNFYFGMCRELTLKGFCGNVKLKSKPGDDHQLRISNTPYSPGDGYFVTENGVQGSGSSVKLYAYFYADSYTLSVSSDDDLNDSGCQVERTFDILKPQLRLRKQNIFLPIDGEPRNPEAYYATVGNAELPVSLFDGEVYAQCLQPQYLFECRKASYSDCLGSGDEGLFLCRMPEKSNAVHYQDNLLSLAQFGVRSRTGDISSGIVGHVDTQYPRWASNSDFQSLTSGYFNSYDKTGSWPAIEGTRLDMFVEECTHTDFVPVSGFLHDIRGSRISVTGNRTHGGSAAKVFFEYAPMDPDYVAAGTAGSPLVAPYGPLSFAFDIRNVHSGETFSLAGKSFTLSYRVDLSAYLRARAHETAADMYFGSPLALMYYASDDTFNGNISDIYGFHMTYYGFLVDGNTGRYPDNPYGPMTAPIVSSNEKIYAGAFGYGNQDGQDWADFKDQEWTENSLKNEILMYNNGFLGETYGWPRSVYFYDVNKAEKHSWTLPDYVFDGHASYPDLKHYLLIESDGHPEIIDWKFTK